MSYNRAYVTITVPVAIHDLPEGVTFEQAAEAMTRSRWDEGRHPFHIEMIHEGLQQEVQWAMRTLVYERMREIYAGEMVPNDDGNGSTARWVIEGDKIRGPFVYIMDHMRKAKIERECDECRGEGFVEKKPENPYYSEHGDREREVCPECGGKGVIE